MEEFKEFKKEKNKTIEEQLGETLPNEVVSEYLVQRFMEDSGFDRGHRGTFESERMEAFIYFKDCFLVESEEYAEKCLKLLRFMTEKGIFYPHTQWRIFYTKKGAYQIFPIVRKLNAWKGEKSLNEGYDVLKGDIGEGNYYRGLMDEDSHVFKWCKRIEPDLQPNKAPQDESLFWLLNIYEASHNDNWGWDENGILYPVDVEVVSVSSKYRDDRTEHEIVENFYK